jgi:Fur family transcriptional regulator, ferric uptake regulator
MVLDSVHDAIGLRLAETDQRYTVQRRAIVETLEKAGRPLTVPEILKALPRLAQSSTYRNLMALTDLGVIDRLVGADEHARFELAETLSGHHHHHLICARCGRVEDLHSSPGLEQALGQVARSVSAEQGFEISDHRIDLIGKCSECRRRAGS